MRDGKLSTRAFSWLIEQANRAGQKKKNTDKPLMDSATPVEQWIILNVARRAKGQRELAFRIPGTIRDVTLADMCVIVASQPDFDVEALKRRRAERGVKS
jgi:hypothetical protein